MNTERQLYHLSHMLHLKQVPEMKEPEKRCCACKLPKPLSAYSENSAKKDGRQAKCKECTSEYQRQRIRERNAGILPERRDKLRKEPTPRTPEKALQQLLNKTFVYNLQYIQVKGYEIGETEVVIQTERKPIKAPRKKLHLWIERELLPMEK